MAIKFVKFYNGIVLQSLTADPSDNVEGSVWYNSTDHVVRAFMFGDIHDIITHDQTQILTNKTIDGDDNTVQDLALSSLKTVLANANNFLSRDGTGAVVDTKAVPSGTVVGTTDTQTLTNKSLVDNSTAIVDNSDATKQIKFDAAGSTGTSTTITGSQTTNRVVTLPDATDTLVGKATTDTLTNKTIDGDDNTVQDLPLTSIKTVLADAGKFIARDASGIPVSTNTVPSGTVVGTTDTQTLTNKSLVDNSTLIVDNSDATKQIAFDAGGTTGTKTTITGAQTSNRVVTLPDATDTLVGKATTDNLTNKNLVDNSTAIVDNSDATKKIVFDAGGTTGTKTTITGAQTADRVLTLPNATDTLVGKATTDSLTNKSLVDNSTAIVDNSDATKQIKFDAAGTTGTSTTLTSSQTTDRVLTLPNATDTLVGKATTDTLTNKTIDGDDNTVQDLPITALKTDIAHAGTFLTRDASGIPISTKNVPSGEVVGDTNLQTLTNKTLIDSSTTIADAGDNTKKIKFDAGGTTGTTSTIVGLQTGNRSIVLPDATTSLVGTDVAQTLTLKTFDDELTVREISTPATPTSPYNKLYTKSDHKLYIKDYTGAETQIGTGSGSGGINYNTNPDFTVDTTGYAAYADTAGTSPVDGTGGSPTTTITRTTSSPLRGVGSGLITKDAANRQGEGVSYDFTIDSADQATVLSVSFDYNPSSAFVSGDSSDIRIWVYDKTNAVLIPVTPLTIQGGSSNNWHFKGTFQTNSNSTSYRLIWHIATTNASAWTFKFDNVIVGPQILVNGSPITDPVAYTPTFTGWGAPTNINFQSWRVGAYLFVEGTFTSGTSTATQARITLGFNGANANVTAKTLSNTMSCGDYILGATATSHGGMILIESAVNYITFGDVSTFGSSSVNATTEANGNAIAANGNTIYLKCKVPIAGWSSTVQMSNDTDSRVVAARYATATAGSYANSSTTILDFNTSSYDTHGAVTTGASWKYTVPVSGIYEVSSRILTDSSTSTGSVQLSLFKNGSTFALLDYYSKSSTDVASRYSLRGVSQVSCVAGDTLDVRFTNGSGATRTLDTDATENYISINRLSGPATVAATESVNASYTGTPTGTLTNSLNTATFPTKQYDTHNAYASGIYTIPVSGTYRVSAFCEITQNYTTATSIGLGIVQAGSLSRQIENYQRGWATASGASYSILITGSFKCVAGDTITVKGYADGASTSYTASVANRDNFSIERVGN